MSVTYQAWGLEAIQLGWPEQVPDAALTALLGRLARQLRGLPGVLDTVPAWNTLLVHYDLLVWEFGALQQRIEAELAACLDSGAAHETGRCHEIPVCYDGPDLSAVAEACGLSVSEVIELHAGQAYRVGAVGFAPGFAYLAELPDALVLPRRATPRTRVPAGSLAIAERQAAIYPQASPGGWHLLGRCPWSMFDLQQPGLCRLEVGDQVRFLPIGIEHFAEAQQREVWP